MPILQPSFRGRLRLFFAVIVVVPMIAVAVVLFQLLGANDTGKVNSKLAEAQVAAGGLFNDARADAGRAVPVAEQDVGLATALHDHDTAAVRAQLAQLARQTDAQRIKLQVDGEGTIETGAKDAIAPSVSDLANAQGQSIGRLTISAMSATELAARIQRILGVDARIDENGKVLATSLPAARDAKLPERGAIHLGNDDYRTTTFSAPAFDGGETVIHLLARDPDEGFTRGTVAVIGLTLGFLVLAAVFFITVSRTLQQEVQRLLVAAQRLGRGDFSVTVPAEGNDEFAALGKEFNSMARELETRLEELRRERGRLQEAIRRVGESFARGLDRVGVLEIVVQTAVDGVGAACGRATMRTRADAALQEVAHTGEPEAYERALHAAELAVMDAGEVAEIQIGGASALAAPLSATEGGDRVLAIVSVARGDRGFSHPERELFSYLTSQAAVSVENVDLHETVQRQAVTDELTGLFNHRRFQEVMAAEVERARRYDQEMGLIMLDIDNFKRVNDTYGHMQGDMVLREVARVLRQSAREIDEPARYGGEEMAVALPQTDLEGAFRFAERVRKRIEALDLPLLDGDGVLKVTASFGAASLSAAANGDKEGLVAAADAALYRAKRSGKNRTVKAE
ncbi:GGDEF domain-containing protein [Candidatus Solirubrobacter pratensis]|uniref:GGDEF domain-containing protein n=1 Tax=Candidatus Solirubrobacter pratensis TaxID=1298857 RepID=UPI00040493FE|nr:GGDEF domain-containing protein [Candidatus Solirubrobacter pratensis]